MGAAGDLGAFLTPDEARRTAAGFAVGAGLLHNAVKAVEVGRRTRALELLSKLLQELGDVSSVRAVLEALGGIEQAARPDLVWTSPSVPGAEGHTTLAVSELINEAEHHVYAATFTATKGSNYMVALQHALTKGVKVTLILDRARQQDYASKWNWHVRDVLPDARIWCLEVPDVNVYAVQHAKVVMVDDRAALVTSANFSEAAAERNLECGVLMRDAGIAKSIRTQLLALRDHGHLVDYKA